MSEADYILLVDDDVDYAPLIVVALRKAGIPNRVEVVNDGVAALNQLRLLARPALMMLDLRLPRLTGFEVLKWVRAREEFHNIPVVVLTGTNNEEELDAAFALGADAFLVKPFHLHDLVRQLQDLWGGNNVGLARRKEEE
jgi:two-component system response regulator